MRKQKHPRGYYRTAESDKDWDLHMNVHFWRHDFEVPAKMKSWRWLNEDRAILAIIRMEDRTPGPHYSAFAVRRYRAIMQQYTRRMEPYDEHYHLDEPHAAKYPHRTKWF
jgi:hypothetical protein